MLTTRSLRLHYWIHKWASLVCTLFLLLLCFTGLPLIFHDEIARFLSPVSETPELAEDAPRVNLDTVVADARGRLPDDVIRFISSDEDGSMIFVAMGATLQATDSSAVLQYDARTGTFLQDSPLQQGFMHLMFKLHVDLFAGLMGMLFLGCMGFLFLVSVISGAVLYGPFMRKLQFGTVRYAHSPRSRWLDLHNLLGIATILWALVVGGTGVVNTLAIPIFSQWQSTQLATMIEPWRDRPRSVTLSSLQQVVLTAQAHKPEKEFAFVAFPGTRFAGDHHYGIYMRGKSPLTKRLITPVLIEAESGQFTGTREMPWYVSVLLISQPLHFGDYGGMPLKIVWALLDLITIIVLISGLYLWWKKRHTSMDQLMAEGDPNNEVVLSAAQSIVPR